MGNAAKITSTKARRGILWVVNGVVVLGVIVLGPPPPVFAAAQPSRAAVVGWYQRVVADLTPLQSSLPASLQAATAWQQGTESAAATRLQIDATLPSLQQAEREIERLGSLEGYGAVHEFYVAGVSLYVEALRVEVAATQLPAGRLATQLQLACARLHELGDVTFDQGTAVLAPVLGAALAGADEQAAAHVPDWTALALAPGAPLVSSWSDGVAGPPATQSPSGWAAGLRAAPLPMQRSLRAALGAKRSAVRLRHLAEALDSADVVVTALASPRGAPRDPVVLRLGLLVGAEAMMAGEAGTLSTADPSSSLLGAARSLLTTAGILRSAA